MSTRFCKNIDQPRDLFLPGTGTESMLLTTNLDPEPLTSYKSEPLPEIKSLISRKFDPVKYVPDFARNNSLARSLGFEVVKTFQTVERSKDEKTHTYVILGVDTEMWSICHQNEKFVDLGKENNITIEHNECFTANSSFIGHRRLTRPSFFRKTHEPHKGVKVFGIGAKVDLLREGIVDGGHKLEMERDGTVYYVSHNEFQGEDNDDIQMKTFLMSSLSPGRDILLPMKYESEDIDPSWLELLTHKEADFFKSITNSTVNNKMLIKFKIDTREGAHKRHFITMKLFLAHGYTLADSNNEKQVIDNLQFKSGNRLDTEHKFFKEVYQDDNKVFSVLMLAYSFKVLPWALIIRVIIISTVMLIFLVSLLVWFIMYRHHQKRLLKLNQIAERDRKIDMRDFYYNSYHKIDHQFDVPASHVKIGRQIGKGHFSSVYIADVTGTPHTKMIPIGVDLQVAFKTTSVSGSEMNKRNAEDEALLTKRLFSLRAPFVVKFLGQTYKEGIGLGILLEYMGGGSLLKWLRERDPKRIQRAINSGKQVNEVDPEEQSEWRAVL